MSKKVFLPDHIEEEMKKKAVRPANSFVSTGDDIKQVFVEKTTNGKEVTREVNGDSTVSAKYVHADLPQPENSKIYMINKNGERIELGSLNTINPNYADVLVKVKKLYTDAKLPEKKSEYAAAFDLYSLEDIEIKTGEVTKARTGIVLEIPNGYKGEIYSRSGLAAKNGVFIVNQPGKIDSDYRGEVFVLLSKCQKGPAVKLSKGSRIAQIEIVPILNFNFVETEELSETERGTGGCGSTGI